MGICTLCSSPLLKNTSTSEPSLCLLCLPCPAQVPAWALMPSQLQQHWIRYSLVGLAAGYGAVFLIRCVRRDSWQPLAPLFELLPLPPMCPP